MLTPWKKSYDKPRQCIRKRHHFDGFSSSHVWMWEVDHKEGWMLKNWCFWIVMLEKTLESPLDCKEIQPVNPKGNQCLEFVGRTDAEAEAPILCLPDANSWLIRKDPDAGKDWRQEKKGMTEDKMVGWHHQTQWTWAWASSGRWWRAGKPGVLQSMGLQRVGHNWVIEQQGTRSNPPQLRVCILQVKVPHSTTKNPKCSHEDWRSHTLQLRPDTARQINA